MFQLHLGVAEAARGVEVREVELRIGCAQFDEEVEDLVQHLVGSRVQPVDLVDDDDGAEVVHERLAQDELGLRQDAFCRVDQ